MENSNCVSTGLFVRTSRVARILAVGIVFVLAGGVFHISKGTACVWVQDAKSDPAQVDGDSDQLTETQQLETDQKRLAERYRLLEEKLFSLHEFEKSNNPIRSKLLERAFLQSQENMTTSQMRQIAKLLVKSNLKAAEKEQQQVLKQLNDLLELLQSEDRGKRVRDEIQRHQEYLKEVERILRIQKGIRGQAEGGLDQKRLSKSEQKTADRTEKLADEIRENEEAEDGAEGDTENPKSDSPDPAERGTQDRDGSGDTENQNQENSNPKNPSDEKGDKDSSGNQPGGQRGQPGQSGQPGQPGVPGQSGGESSDSETPNQNENPTRRRIQAAEERMRDAKQKLDQAKRDEAIEQMKSAEREMALAKQQLEKILRQLREEEIERTLAMLEGRFRKMLEREIRVLDSTKKLDQVVTEQRGTDFEIRAGRLSGEQNSIATEAERALLLLREDGSSVAFPATVDELHQDMLQIVSRLSAAKVGQITIEIEEDIVETLDYLVKALVKTQEDMERMKQQQQEAKGGQAGDKPLVDQLAEIKMLRGLQERILRRHQRYSRFLEDPNDLIGATEDPELHAALSRLAEKQAQLTEIARDLVNEKNK